MKKILIVGAGFAGSVAARILADKGFQVLVIDQRAHIAGNAYDFVDGNGIRVHKYGPHLFHTNNMRVVEWLSSYTGWVNYSHKVQARLPNGSDVPLPVNRTTIQTVFNIELKTEGDVKDYLQRISIAYGRDPRNAQEYLYSQIGESLTQLFFAPYTRKMWGYDLSSIDPSVVKRIPIRSDDEDRYFPADVFQALPSGGYSNLIGNMIDHPGIIIKLGTKFSKDMLAHCDAAFLCCPIDEFYENKFGELPYRSIKFHHESIDRNFVNQQTVTLNFTDASPYTRRTLWHLLPEHDSRSSEYVTQTTEEPCDYTENNFERYYPVKTADDEFGIRYKKYAELAARDEKIVFLGRCGTYQYLDMHQVIAQTITRVEKWLEINAQ